jgi:hypothetical protein
MQSSDPYDYLYIYIVYKNVREKLFQKRQKGPRNRDILSWTSIGNRIFGHFFYDLPHVISYSIPKHSKCHSKGLFQALSTNFCVFQLEKNIVY